MRLIRLRGLAGVAALTMTAAAALLVPAVASTAVPLTKTRAERYAATRALATYGAAVSGQPSASAACTAKRGRFACRYILSGTAGTRMIGQASVWRDRGRLRARVARPAAVSRTTLQQAKPVAEQAVAARHPNARAVVGCTSVTKAQVLNATQITCKYLTVLPDGDQRAGTVKLAVSVDGVPHATVQPARRTVADGERMFALKTGTQPSAVNCEDFEPELNGTEATNGHTLSCTATTAQGTVTGDAEVSTDGTITATVRPPVPPGGYSPTYGSSYTPCYSCGSTYVPGYYVPGSYVPGEYISGVGYVPGVYVPGTYIPGGYY
jgi:hypothetical protein